MITFRKVNLRVGDWVEVKSAAEILGTLDENGSLEGLPFMPEMLQYCGKRYRVYKSAHKTCDTIRCYEIRHMGRAVFLDGLRCDGKAHGGCEALCLIFWKEAWLRRVDGPDQSARAGASATPPQPVASSPVIVSRLHDLTQRASFTQDGRYRCQATDLFDATSDVRRRDRWNPLFYYRDVQSGNVRLFELIRYGTLAAINAFTLRWFKRRYPDVHGECGQKTPHEELGLQAGELVQVRSKQEILNTLNSRLRNRGLLFDVEMVPYCDNGTYRVLKRVERIVDDKTGKLITMPNPCLILDGVVCGGKLSVNRMFCPRSIFPYWREIWLRRDSASNAQGAKHSST